MEPKVLEKLDFLRICRCCLLQLEDGRKLKPLYGSAVDAMLKEVNRLYHWLIIAPDGILIFPLLPIGHRYFCVSRRWPPGTDLCTVSAAGQSSVHPPPAMQEVRCSTESVSREETTGVRRTKAARGGRDSGHSAILPRYHGTESISDRIYSGAIYSIKLRWFVQRGSLFFVPVPIWTAAGSNTSTVSSRKWPTAAAAAAAANWTGSCRADCGGGGGGWRLDCGREWARLLVPYLPFRCGNAGCQLNLRNRPWWAQLDGGCSGRRSSSSSLWTTNQ